MPRAEANEDYKARQREAVRVFTLTPGLDELLTGFAEENSMSVSEVIREAIQSWTGVDTPPIRKRRTRRRSVWIQPELFVEFQRKAAASGLTQVEAIEAALGDAL